MDDQKNNTVAASQKEPQGSPSNSSGLLAFPGWISVDDEMPQNGEEVLVRNFAQQISQATRDTGFAGGWKQRNCSGWECLSHCATFVTHFARIAIPQPQRTAS